MDRIPRPGDLYRHVTNKRYQIAAVAVHAQTGEQMVVYQELFGNFHVCVDAMEHFLSEADLKTYPHASQRFIFEKVEKERPDTVYAKQVYGRENEDMEAGAEWNAREIAGMQTRTEKELQTRNMQTAGKTKQEPQQYMRTAGKTEQEPQQYVQTAGKTEQEPQQYVQTAGKTGREPQQYVQTAGKTGREPQQCVQTAGKTGREPQQCVQTAGKTGQEPYMNSGAGPQNLLQAEIMRRKNAKTGMQGQNDMEPDLSVQSAPQARPHTQSPAESGRALRQDTFEAEGTDSYSLKRRRQIEEREQRRGLFRKPQRRESATEELRANPCLLKFLDADTYEEKYQVLNEIQDDITDRLIDDIAVVLDVVIPEGPLLDRYHQLRNIILTRQKYETNRFR